MQYLSPFAEEIALAIKEQREAGTLDVNQAVVSINGKRLVEKSAMKSTIGSSHFSMPHEGYHFNPSFR